MELIRWQPWDELDRTLEDALVPFRQSKIGWDTAVDVYEKDNAAVVEMHLPGVDSEKLELWVVDNTLHANGSREEIKEEKGKTYTRKEIVRGAFARAVVLPSAVDEKKAQARYRDGVLTVVLPKLEQQNGGKSRIPIQKA